MRKIALFISLIFFLSQSMAQEFDCQISVSAPKVEGTDRRVFETMQSALYEFINNRKWTNYNIKVEERIECSFMLTINERLSSDEFKGTLNLVLRRPVYNTSYNSILLNYIDKDITINYVEYQPLDYSDGTFTSNLTSIFAFYNNIFLGLYFDSFSPFGGTPFYEKAQSIVSSAQNTREPGWKAYESQKNRFWLVENLQNPGNASIREFSYQFHRQGLDAMYEKVDQGRGAITESIDLLKKMYAAKPDLFLLQLMLDAKRDEFVNIYADQKVPPMEKTSVVNTLKEIDPANSSKYQAILESK